MSLSADSRRFSLLSNLLSPLIELDCRVTSLFQRLELGALEVCLAPFALAFGWFGSTLCVMPLMYLVHGERGLRFWLVSCCMGQIVNRFLKQIVQRVRPAIVQPEPRRFLAALKRYLYNNVHAKGNKDGASFPSGDTMSAGVAGGCLAILYGSPLPVLLPMLASVGRQYYFCHYWLDTLVGGSIGFIAPFVVDSYVHRGHSHKNLTNNQVAVCAIVFLVLMKVSTPISRRVRVSVFGLPAGRLGVKSE